MQRRAFRNGEVRDRHDDREHREHAEQDVAAAFVIEQAPRQHHASAARPFCGNRPRGRFWMKMMRKINTKILAITAPAAGSSSLLASPSDKPLTSVPQRLPTPP